MLCRSILCPKYNLCAKALSALHVGTDSVESLATYGSGAISQDGIRLLTACGPDGDYKMFIPRIEGIDEEDLTSVVFERVRDERNLQEKKWGAHSKNHPFEWMSILGEEYGELCQAVNESCFKNPTHPERGGTAKMIAEATQVAAVAVAFIEQLLKENS